MLQVKDLYVAYGQSEALHGISFEGRANETVAIMGRNGMGKTTLFKSLMGVLPIKTGTVTVAGQDVSGDESYRRVAKGIAYVPQGRMIFPTLTVEENIQTGLENSKTKQIPEEIYALFPVLWDMRRRKGGNLSGGQQQQLAIARALAAGPKLLVLDEPTEGIQPSIIKDIGRVLRMLADTGLNGQRMSILLCEQYYDFAQELADDYLVMERGEVIARGPGSEMEAKGVRQLVSI